MIGAGDGDRSVPVLAMRGIEKSFGPTRALRGVDLEVRAGEVHALIGENGAGKSTLLNTVAGALLPDAGRILLDGKEMRFATPAEARAAGIALIHQELSLFPHLSVEANILMGFESARAGFLARAENRARAKAILSRFSHPAITLDRRAGDLPIAAQQVVEICRALLGKARVLLMDEPTSSLERRDVGRLFELIGGLKREGMAIVYISHFLEELRAVADRFTVLRDGETVGGGAMAAYDDAAIVALMVGRTVDELYPSRKGRAAGERVLSVRGLSAPPGLVHADLDVHAGEVLGVAGIVGSGRSELLRALAGLDPAQGEVTVRGQVAAQRGFAPAQRIRLGLGYLSEDRKREGLALSMSIADNLILSSLGRSSRAGVLDLRRQAAESQRWIETLAVRAASPWQRVGSLSGGNQQKIALGRLLQQDAQVFLLDEPTRGVDIGSKAQLYLAIDEAARAGKAVVVVSSYLPELFGLCDRLAVMCRGRLSEARPIGDWSPESVMAVATGAALEAAA